MYHKVVIVGYLGRDPEMRYTGDGTPVTNFSVATSRKWNNPDGTKGEETVWFRVTAWRRQAEICNEYLSKGRLVLVEGRINPDRATGGPRIWTGQDGIARASYEVTAIDIKFLGSRADAGAAFGGGTSEESPPYDEGDGGDIPF